MANPALKKREEVITDLNDAEFPEKQSRAIVQAVVDTTASLGLVTRADLAVLDKKIDDFKADLNKRIDELKGDMDRLHRAIFWGLVIGFTVLGFLLR